jgi:large subunit ribosomal protein L17
MYKRIKGKKFSRKTDQRRAFMRGLAVNLIMQERIKTTKVRARQVASFVEKLITKAKKNDLAAKKALVSVLPETARKKLAAAIAPRFKDRNGGYTRIAKLGPRAKDGAPMAIVELLDRTAVEPKVIDKNKKASSKKEKRTAKAAKKAEGRAKIAKKEKSK